MDTLRVLTLNIWGEQPPLERRMSLIEKGIRELRPDVVGLQEVRQIEGQLINQAQTIAAHCGYEWTWREATSWGGGKEGVALLSRFPMGEAKSVVLAASIPEETRVLLMA